MRKITFGVGNSLDNFIARKDHAVDWLMWTNEISEITAQYWKTIDTILMGRKTYEIGLKLSKGKSHPFAGTKNYVFSRTLKGEKNDGVEIVSENAEEFVRNLKNESGKDICLMGGGELAKSLFEADLIDELVLNIHPILLGSGSPLFVEMSRQINLELFDSKVLKNGCVVVSYRVKRDGK